MPTKCSQCGAPLAPDEQCIDRFNAGQIKEAENPTTFYAVHHLSVPCYMLQHNSYSRRGWLEVRKLLYQFLYEGLTPARARQQYRQSMNSGKRTWSLTRGEKLAQVQNVVWTWTVANVRIDTAENYCADVTEWARHILADSQAMVQALK